jgi:hypothetical protein
MDYIKLGMIMQTYGTENPKKHQIYLSDSIYSLVNKEIIGEADTYKEACAVIKEGLAQKGLEQEPYWRIVLDPEVTFIDFGSWSKFAAIVPAIDPKEMERPVE